MNPIKALKQLFKKKKVLPIQQGERIQLKEAFWAHREGHNETYKSIGNLVTIYTDNVLKFIEFKNGYYYFVLFSYYKEDTDNKGSVVYFSESTFLKRLKYKKL